MEKPKQMEEPINKDELKKLNLLEYSTIGYAILIFLGYSYIDFYYRYWEIQIYSFLDVSEIMLPFLNIFNTLLLYLITISIPIILNNISKLYKYVANKKNINICYIKFKGLTVLRIYLVLLILFALFCLYKYITGFNLYYFYVTVAVIIVNIFQYINKVFSWLIKHDIWPFNKIYYQSILVILLIYILGFLSANYQFKATNSKQIVTSISFNYESIPYKTNDSLLYIGATSKYVFIRNTKSKTNLIFDKASIKNLSLNEKYNTNKTTLCLVLNIVFSGTSI